MALCTVVLPAVVVVSTVVMPAVVVVPAIVVPTEVAAAVTVHQVPPSLPNRLSASVALSTQPAPQGKLCTPPATDSVLSGGLTVNRPLGFI
ncbi:hypothetical protein [Kitasatospora acidiphila]|uniref:hypothetical protein n=1 Tax=Kitasatospora acidiphila TaxID=2567942 RepID=UPI003C72390E